MPLCLKPQDRYKVRGVDQGFVFGSLSSGKLALVCPFPEYFDPRQNSWIDSERNQASRRLRIETLAQRLKKVVESGGRVHAFKLSQGSRRGVLPRLEGPQTALGEMTVTALVRSLVVERHGWQFDGLGASRSCGHREENDGPLLADVT
jgi:phenylpropionate dioxygenase-like ring-hydroxylating dioxygenase large terminal subunit